MFQRSDSGWDEDGFDEAEEEAVFMRLRIVRSIDHIESEMSVRCVPISESRFIFSISLLITTYITSRISP